MKYEDMVEDLETQIKRIVDFLDVEVTPEFFNIVLKDAGFESMKHNPSTNYNDNPYIATDSFIRKGKVGGWKDYFTVAQNEWFEETYRKQLDESGIDLRFELVG